MRRIYHALNSKGLRRSNLTALLLQFLYLSRPEFKGIKTAATSKIAERAVFITP